MMKTNLHSILIILVIGMMNACGIKQDSMPTPEADAIVISVGEVEVTIGDTLLAFQESMDLKQLMANNPVEEASKALTSLSHLTAFQNYLSNIAREAGLDQTDAFQNYKKQITEEELAQKLVVEEVLKSIRVTENDVKEFYELNQDTLFLMKDSHYYEVRGIYTVKDQHEAGEAERLIHEAHEKLKQNLRFESVAKDYSDAPSYMRGDKNRFSPKNFSPTALEVLEQLKDGEYSEVMDWGDRYMILKRESYAPPEYAQLEDARQLILTQLTQQQTERKMFQLMEQLKQKHPIIVNEDLVEQAVIEDPSVVIISIADIKEITYQDFEQLVLEKNLNSLNTKKELLNQLVFKSLCLAEALDRGWGIDEVMRPVTYWCERELSKNYILSQLGSVSSDELLRQYEEKKGHASLKTPKYIDLSRLFFRVPNLTQSSRYEQQLYYQSAYAKAMRALKDVQAGKRFDEVVALNATGDNGAVIGEHMGRISVQQLSPSVQNMIKDLKVGETSEPKKINNLSRNRYGYELFHIHSIEEPQPLPQEEALKVIAQQMAQERYREQQETLQKDFFEQSNKVIHQESLHSMIDYLVYLHHHPDQQADISKYVYGESDS